MDQPQARYLQSHVEQSVLVLTITEPNIQGEEIAEVLREEMLAAVARSGLRKVAVDFRLAHYLSSTAFRPLLALRRKLREEAGQLVLCGLNSSIGDVFYTTKMIDPTGAVTTVFEMQADVPAAVAYLNAAPAQA